MALDFLKLLFTYGTALVVVVGGLALLYLTRSEPTSDNLQLLLGGFIGSALTWLFGETTRSSTARQTSRALAIVPGNGTTPPPGEPTA